MFWVVAVKADEVLPVVGEDSALIGVCEAQHFVIRDGVVGFASFERGKHVMAQFAQAFQHGPVHTGAGAGRAGCGNGGQPASR